MIEGDFFVTPHAVRRFQQRIAPLSYEAARTVIVEGLHDPKGVKRLGSGQIGVRVRKPYEFRAVIGPGDGERPAVVTILRSGHAGAKWRRAEDRRPAGGGV